MHHTRVPLAMSTVDLKKSQKLSEPAATKRACKACGKEFGLEEYFDHVYDNDECYKAYLASEMKEMSKL
ncbi:MAG: hypothetical protein ACRECH_10930 [Nitrososphaerales archaeon]